MELDSPRGLYNNPDHVFAGWFLGSPWVHFMTNCFTVNNGTLESPLLATTLQVSPEAAAGTVLGIRPEIIRGHITEDSDAVAADVTSNAIPIGGQILLELSVQGIQFKAVVEHHVGREAGERLWVEFPAAAVHMFGADDRVVNLGLSRA